MMKKIVMLLGIICLAGCTNALLTALVLVKGRDEPPKYDILLKGEKRVAVVPRAMVSNPYELQNAPREIARYVNRLIDDNVQNKKLRVIEQSKVETILDACNNDFDSFTEIGKDKSINADIVIGFDIIGFQIRDPHSPHLIQGRCQVSVKAVECATGKVLASENLTIVDPPNMPLADGPGKEPLFRSQFIQVVAQQITVLFHHHDPHKVQRMDVDNLELH